MSDITVNRKYEHIDIVVKENVVYPSLCSDIYRGIKFVHNAFPGLSYDDIDLSINFLGYSLGAPLMITGITGGHVGVTKINELLAKIAEKYCIAIGVGSQRAMIEAGSPEIIESYTVVRRIARNVPVIGNIGINSLNKIDLRLVVEAINRLNADALAIHLNPAQELIQPEGEAFFPDTLLNKLSELMDLVNVPILIKEVGNGLSMEVVRVFHGLGIEIFDVAGACGTSWIAVEVYRAEKLGYRDKVLLGKKLGGWGIPTPLSVIETRWAAPSAWIIASGGVWDGYKAALNIALGANMAGLALPILRAIINGGFEGGSKYIERYINELKAVMFLTGSSNIRDLMAKPLYLSSDILAILSSRGIDWNRYIEVKRG